ncbi:hypothetical protein MLD38_012402 [Melastoma candidum]|uniref:Uncharacterized protein n=1 Tax=Melastoma candidum TaxID=119954 RepID=A0ACB9R6A8_9MYRT|nr:hypothetical protein MLD38_012402 [Melastoma candidum]
MIDTDSVGRGSGQDLHCRHLQELLPPSGYKPRAIKLGEPCEMKNVGGKKLEGDSFEVEMSESSFEYPSPIRVYGEVLPSCFLFKKFLLVGPPLANNLPVVGTKTEHALLPSENSTSFNDAEAIPDGCQTDDLVRKALVEVVGFFCIREAFGLLCRILVLHLLHQILADTEISGPARD